LPECASGIKRGCMVRQSHLIETPMRREMTVLGERIG
jgi:hypothetical protein